jgi:hypothetical protein
LLRQPEVRDEGLAPLVQDDVGRLQVPVQNAALVRVVDGPRHLDEQFGGPARGLAELAQAISLLPIFLAKLAAFPDFP